MQFLDIKETAVFLKISVRTLRNRMAEDLPYNQQYKRGKLTFDKFKVIKWWEKYNHPCIRLYRRG